jgi:hypothetical protein
VGVESADLLVEDRFAIVPEWLLDAEISDAAVRLYAVLLRYGNSSGARMPSRSTLARRLHKRSTDSVDRAMKELVAIGAVVVEHRYDGSQRLTNAYYLRTSRPCSGETPTPPTRRSGRKSAATPTVAAGGGRTDAARVAAEMRHDPEHLTDSTTSSSPAGRGAQRARTTTAAEELAVRCGIEDWAEFLEDVRQLRRAVGAPTTRWAARNLLAALCTAVDDRGWPSERAATALKAVAADPATRSPMRVAEAGPWWDEPTDGGIDPDELAAMEAALLEAGGARIELQKRARRDLEAAGMPLTRAAVTARAYDLLTAETGAA